MGNSDSWNDGSAYLQGKTFSKSTTATQRFSKAYSRPPVVFVSTSKMYTSEDHRVHFATGVKNVDRHGFTLVCASEAYTGTRKHYVGDLRVRWISVAV